MTSSREYPVWLQRELQVSNTSEKTNSVSKAKHLELEADFEYLNLCDSLS